MDLINKKVLVINLETQQSEVKVFPNLKQYIGGIGIALQLYHLYKDSDPLIFAVGPLNGFFPFASKTCVVLENDGNIEDVYVGGNLASRIKFTGVDAVVITKIAAADTILEIKNTHVKFSDVVTDVASLGLPGRRSNIDWFGPKLMVDKYFYTPEDFLESKFAKKNLRAISITGTEIMKPQDFGEYQRAYSKVLERQKDITIETSNYPSCNNCPIGCMLSKTGEIGGDVVAHSLVTCQYAEKIYSDVGIIFSCLNALGYNYTHEAIENLPKLIQETLSKLG
jgi:hypothetical protein